MPGRSNCRPSSRQSCNAGCRRVRNVTNVDECRIEGSSGQRQGKKVGGCRAEETRGRSAWSGEKEEVEGELVESLERKDRRATAERRQDHDQLPKPTRPFLGLVLGLSRPREYPIRRIVVQIVLCDTRLLGDAAEARSDKSRSRLHPTCTRPRVSSACLDDFDKSGRGACGLQILTGPHPACS